LLLLSRKNTICRVLPPGVELATAGELHDVGAGAAGQAVAAGEALGEGDEKVAAVAACRPG
jgi:hypothetical protein